MAYRKGRSAGARRGRSGSKSRGVRSTRRSGKGRMSSGGKRGATHVLRIVVDQPANSGQSLTAGQAFQKPAAAPRQRQF